MGFGPGSLATVGSIPRRSGGNPVKRIPGGGSSALPLMGVLPGILATVGSIPRRSGGNPFKRTPNDGAVTGNPIDGIWAGQPGDRGINPTAIRRKSVQTDSGRWQGDRQSH